MKQLFSILSIALLIGSCDPVEDFDPVGYVDLPDFVRQFIQVEVFSHDFSACF